MKIRGLICIKGWFYYRPPQRDGIRPKRIALRTRSENEAITLAIELKDKSDESISGGRLSGEIQRYLATKNSAGEWTRATSQATTSTLRQLELFLGNPIVTGITRAKIEDWRASMISKGMPDSSVKTYLRRAQGLFTWLADEGKIAISPFAKLRVGKIKSAKAVQFCTRLQRDHLLTTCQDPDLRFVLMCGFFLGLRRREIVEAVPEWFRTPGVVEIAETPHYKPKDKERRMIHYGKRFSKFLLERESTSPWMLRPHKKHGKSTYRVETKKWIEQLAVTCEIPWFRHHTMRHTFATLHVQAGTPLPTVADWLGDSYQVTHEHYVAYAPNQAHVGNLD